MKIEQTKEKKKSLGKKKAKAQATYLIPLVPLIILSITSYK